MKSQWAGRRNRTAQALVRRTHDTHVIGGMLLWLGVVFALQVHAARDTAQAATRADTPLVATPAQIANAYEDSTARTLVARARAARVSQDSSLKAYDATAKRRFTVNFGLGAHGPERLLIRSEGASRVRWTRGVGAHIDVLAARTAIPLAYPGARVLSDMLDDNPVPYFPGREGLVGFSEVVRSRRRHGSPMIHPLEDGAESMYRFATGDSVSLAFPDGRRIRLREIRVIPRAPRYDLIVGSLWIDASSGQLVRAVYRPAADMDIADMARRDDPHSFDDVPTLVKPLIFPMRATVSAFIVEYGLVDERWWMPRVQTIEGRARIGPTHATFSVEQNFRYASVNVADSLPPIAVAAVTDSAREARRDSIRAARRRERRHGEGDDDPDMQSIRCPRADTLVRYQMRHGGALPIEIRIPCDTAALAHSPELPPSIFDSGAETFGVPDRDAVLKSLGLGVQPGWSPGAPSLHYGLEDGLTRYNRVEGLSLGARLDEQFGAGLSGSVTGRFGVADLQPGFDAQVQRSDGVRTLSLGAYRRLVPVSPWGDPFSLGSSIGALMLGNDDAFYYRAWGAELGGRRDGRVTIQWRAFAEDQRNADVNTPFSLYHALGARDGAPPNIRAARAGEAGGVVSAHDEFGLDPAGWRVGLGASLEGAAGTFDYGRGSLDASVSRGIWSGLDASLSASAGTSVGTVAPQRLWYLGGAQTVRGQIMGAEAGDAYWFSRAELGYGLLAFRPTVFFDIGWAGARSDWSSPGRPISGAGVGLSLLDGLLHVDLAHGIQPSRSWRGAMYLEARP